MWVNMKPYTSQLYSRTAIPYTIGISDQTNFLDQKRNMIKVHPGKETVIKVIPRLLETTAEYDALPIKERQCKLSHETNGLGSLTKYSRVGCELDCAMKRAISVCKCIPWHYPNNFEKHLMCEMFGGYCFDRMMTDDVNYRYCKYQCLKDCHETEYIIFDNVFPIDYNKVCDGRSFQNTQFIYNFEKHFAFQNYQTLVQAGHIPDLATSFSNGSLCQDYVKNYVGFVNVYSPAAYVLLTKRDKAVFFYDQIGTIGGTFGLFVGCSLLSLAEVAILIVIIVYNIWQNIKDFIKDPIEFVKNCLFSKSTDVGELSYDKRMDRFHKATQVSIISTSK